MRLVVHEYENGQTWAVRFTNDGMSILDTLKGEQQPDSKTEAYVQVACGDTDASMKKLEEAIAWAASEVAKRRAADREAQIPHLQEN